MELTKIDRVKNPADRKLACPQCGAAYGTRKVRLAQGWGEEAYIHEGCYEKWRTVTQHAFNERRKAEEEAQRAKLKAEREARQAERGTDPRAWLKRDSKGPMKQEDVNFVNLISKALGAQERGRTAKKEFLARYEADALEALRWQDDYVRMAARRRAADHAVGCWTAGMSYEETLAELTSEALRRGSRLEHSTSVGSNATEDAIRAAYCELARGNAF